MASGSQYSALVTGLKLILPLTALGILSTLFLFTETPDPQAAIPYAEVDVEALAREQRLTRPRFAGVLEDGRELTILAEAIRPSFDEGTTNANAVFTEDVIGHLGLSDLDTLDIAATLGRFDINAQAVELGGGVAAETTTSGYAFETETLTVALTQLGLETDDEIVITGPQIVLTAGAMDLTGPSEAGVARFTGGVRLIYQPQ